MPRQKGICKFYDKTKGYGFISPNEGKGDIYVHYSSIKSPGKGEYKNSGLNNGQEVEFDVEFNDYGGKAVNITSPGKNYLYENTQLNTSISNQGFQPRKTCYTCGADGHFSVHNCYYIYTNFHVLITYYLIS